MPQRFRRLLALGTQAVLVAALLVVVVSAVLRVFDFSRPGDYGEGPVLGMVERLSSDGEPISIRWLDGPPYTLTCYGPAYYWVVGAASAILPWQHTLVAGRLVSLLATLATAALLGLAVGRSTHSGELGLATALIFLVSPIVHAWGTTHRVDPLATLFAVAAFLAVKSRGSRVESRERRSPHPATPSRRTQPAGLASQPSSLIPHPLSLNPHPLSLNPHPSPLTSHLSPLCLSAACVVAGSLVKQTAALAAVPIFWYLLLSKRPGAAVKYALLVAVPGAALWFALDRLTGGYFFATAIRGNLGRLSLMQGFWAGQAFLCTPLGCVAGLLVAWRWVRRPAAAIGSLWCVGFVLSTLIAAALSTKEGAAANYFLEASALGAVVIGLYGLGPLWKRRPGRTLGAIALAALVMAAPDARCVKQRGFTLDREPFGGSLVARRLRQDGSDAAGVLADGQLVPAAIHAGFNPLVNDPFVFRLLVGQGRIDAGPLVEAIREGRVGHLVLKQSLEVHRQHLGRTSQKWPTAVLDAMQQSYVLEAVAEDVFIYRPRRAAERGTGPSPRRR